MALSMGFPLPGQLTPGLPNSQALGLLGQGVQDVNSGNAQWHLESMRSMGSIWDPYEISRSMAGNGSHRANIKMGIF